jgi:hypothetical protein
MKEGEGALEEFVPQQDHLTSESSVRPRINVMESFSEFPG